MRLNDKEYFLRMALLAFALLIAFASLYYTDDLVQKLGQREKKLIDLYAKGLESAAKTEDLGNLSFLFQEIIQANTSVPVILANGKHEPISFKNMEIPDGLSQEKEKAFLAEEMNIMKEVYPPIEIEYSPGFKNYIYYKNSFILTQLRYYPYLQLTSIFIFILLGYLVLNNSRRAEQNRVWVGMSKETAHQLATPLSSLMAWMEIFKQDENFSHPDAVVELEKDIQRLETITARFSNIGSAPALKEESVLDIITLSIKYLQIRVSPKVIFVFDNQLSSKPIIMVNKSLFEWALENIVKNGVDAMSGVGKITIRLSDLDKNKIAIDIKDTGKGIAKNQIRKVFDAGFTTKQRGWGLGLTLTRRIIEQYHGGKVYVKQSEMGKGTVFRIIIDTIL